jgi:hypothetical protein
MMRPNLRRKLMSDFRQPVQKAVRDATASGMFDATTLLLDLRDDRAHKMAADFAELDTLRTIVTKAEGDHTVPVLIACLPSDKAEALLDGLSTKSKRKFATRLAGRRFRMIVIGGGGITWAVGVKEDFGPMK